MTETDAAFRQRMARARKLHEAARILAAVHAEQDLVDSVSEWAETLAAAGFVR